MRRFAVVAVIAFALLGCAKDDTPLTADKVCDQVAKVMDAMMSNLERMGSLPMPKGIENLDFAEKNKEIAKVLRRQGEQITPLRFELEVIKGPEETKPLIAIALESVKGLEDRYKSLSKNVETGQAPAPSHVRNLIDADEIAKIDAVLQELKAQGYETSTLQRHKKWMVDALENPVKS